MKNHKLLYVLLICAILSCKKVIRDDLNGKSYIHGQLLYINNLAQNDSIIPLPLGGRNVEIGYASDSTINYIYSVTTDINGYFTFTNLDLTKHYVVFSRDTMGDVIYFKERDIPVNTPSSIDTLTVKLVPSNVYQNGFVLTVEDSTHMPVGACAVCLFKSKILFQADTCGGASYVLTSDPFGNAYQVNVPDGQWYVFLREPYYKSFLTGKDSISVGPTGISKKTVFIK